MCACVAVRICLVSSEHRCRWCGLLGPESMYVWGGNGRVYGIDPVSEDTSFAPAEEFHRKEKVGERSSLPPLALPLLVGLLQ